MSVLKKTILVIGIGAGNPDHLTLQAIKAIRRADVFFIPGKGDEKADLAALRHAILAEHLDRPHRVVPFDIPKRAAPEASYREAVDDWHTAIATIYRRLIEDELGDCETGAFLVWGDPSLYDSVLRILDRVAASGLAFDRDVIPGITSVQALAASHAIALNRIGEPFVVTTGRRLRAGWPPGADDVVVMLDGECSFKGLDPEVEIYWGAYLGTPDEIVISGKLADVADQIEAKRAEARAQKGWIMDVYLLRRHAE